MSAFSYIIKNEKEKFQTLDPYENGPETCGSPSIDLKQFKTQALEAIKDEIPLRIHTIGDRAVREMLDIFEEGTKLYGKRDI